MGKYFGTDGVRGIANKELTPELAFGVGKALAASLREIVGRKPRVCIGRDTRISGTMLESALSAGVTSAGGDVWLLGVLPTPAVALLAKEEKMDAGIVISASHNPFEHNGIKIFGGSGYKLDDSREEEIEKLIDGELVINMPECVGGEIGVVSDHSAEACKRYSAYIASRAHGRLDGMRVLLDCANGASSHTAELIFSALGADFDIIHNAPDGVNINNGCGSTHMESLCQKVREGDYVLGAAFDGDADRCLLCDENGKLIDGDDILALMAEYLKSKGKLTKGVVATIMSNMGLRSYLAERGIDTAAVKVGDRHVLEEMLTSGSNLGGEQSGHVIFSDHATTGDGQLTAVMFMMMLKERGVPASELTKNIFHYPQVIVNLDVPNHIKNEVAGLESVKKVEREIVEVFGGDGRVNIRPSGTEALVRIMVEGKDEQLVRQMADKAKAAVADAVKERLRDGSDY